MRTLTESQATQLLRDLVNAADELRESAAQHLYRADAHHAVGDRVMARYHRDRAEAVHTLASALTAWRAVVAQRTSPAPVRARSTPQAVPESSPDVRSTARRGAA